METMKVHNRDGKYFLSIDLVDLPEGVAYQPGYKVLTDDGEYICGSVDRDLVKSTGHQEW